MRGLAGLAVGVALLFAACGDDDSDAEAFVADADAICTTLAEDELAAYAAVPGPALSPEYLEEVAGLRAEAIADLEALDPPEDSAGGFDEYLATLEQANAVVDDAIDAVADDDLDALLDARAEARELRLEANETGAGIGFVACAGVLSDADAEEITETLELSIDPGAARELCRERATETFIAARFASVADCERAQGAGTTAETVTVTELQGVEGVSANVLAELGDADGGSAEYEASLAYEDGVWKLNSIAPTEPTG